MVLYSGCLTVDFRLIDFKIKKYDTLTMLNDNYNFFNSLLSERIVSSSFSKSSRATIL